MNKIEFMRKSQYGKNLRFHWEGYIPLEQVVLIPTHSTLDINPEMQEKLKLKLEETLKANPNYDIGKKLRTEFVHYDEKTDKVLIFVSPTDYFTHSILRKEPNQAMQFYPNPITINTIQETKEGYLLLGIRNPKVCDQANLAFIGAGFVERTEPQETIAKRVKTECEEETKYFEYKEGKKTSPFNIKNAKALCVVTGSNTDTSVVTHLPLDKLAWECSPGNNEYNQFVYLSTSPREIKRFLDNGGYCVSENTDCIVRDSNNFIDARAYELFSSGRIIPAADHLLGGLEAYLHCKEKGLIRSRY